MPTKPNRYFRLIQSFAGETAEIGETGFRRIVVRAMRELIERFNYRFQLWQKERYEDHWGADPAASRNPLRFVAVVAVISLVIDATEPLVFHRAVDIAGIIRIPVALVFIILYQLKSRWAWHLIVAWWPFAFVAYWLLRFAGYLRYQPRVHSVAFNLGFIFFDVALFVAVLIWLIRARDRYFRYIQDAAAQQT